MPSRLHLPSVLHTRPYIHFAYFSFLKCLDSFHRKEQSTLYISVNCSLKLHSLLRQMIQLHLSFQTYREQQPTKFGWNSIYRSTFSSLDLFGCNLHFQLIVSHSFVWTSYLSFISYFFITVMIKQIIVWLEWKWYCSFGTNMRISLILVWVWTQTQVYNAPCCKSFAGKENPIQDKATVPSNENFFLTLVKIWKHDTILWLKPVNKKSNYDYLPG